MRTMLAMLALTLAADSGAAEPAPKGTPNRLAKESSPYLLQHAHNPVDWFPWSEEAFAKAKKEGKLVFLSIGYSSCHWCHVMEKESFSDAEVAKILNDHFVCIKVDREERPDIDEIYMTAVQVIGGSGGWPLNLFLTAEGKPVIGGTYWPKEDKKVGEQTANGFKTILKVIIDLHKDKPKELREQAEKIATATSEFLDRAAKAVPLAELEPAIIKTAVDSFIEDIDPEHGGIGRKARDFTGTKFPMPAAIGFLYEQTRRDTNRELRILMRLTLEKMALGGIYDQLGGGFHRYSTERTWTVPHFEKMLYDNAQLVELYALAQETEPQPLYKRTIDETLGFIAREMTSPDGAFYSALDADSNGTEGEFYVWTADEIEKILGSKTDAILFAAVYGSNPNFEKKYQILKQSRPLAEVAKDQRLTEDELIAKIAPMKAKLFNERAKRERPFLDTKVMTNWNGQMIAGYAAAGRVLKNPKYIDAAKKAAEFVLKNLRAKDGRLWHVFTDGKARLNAYQDDYAFLVHGLLNLADATNEPRWLDEAKALTETMIKWHGEEKRGGYFFTSHDHEKLFARSKDHYDGAQPSGNAVAARNFVRLFQKTGDKAYRDLAEKSYTQFAGVMKNNPTNVPALLLGLGAFFDAKKATLDDPRERNFVNFAADPLDSSRVVKATVEAGAIENGKQKLTVTLVVEDPWHIYANPVKSPMLKGGETNITFKSGDKVLKALIEYPKGKVVEDTIVGDHVIWEGKVVIPVVVERDATDAGPIDLAIKVTSCKENLCLRPATIKIATK